MAAPTRRGLLAGAGLLAGSVSLLGLAGSAQAQAQLSADGLTIEAAVRLEQLVAVVYQTLSARASLGTELRDLFGLFAEQEQAHAQGLLALAEYLGGAPPAVPTVAQAELALPRLSAARSRPAALALAQSLEQSELQSFYFDEQTLSDIKLMELVAAVMCGDAQHLVLVRQAVGVNPIPAAFETGQENG